MPRYAPIRFWRDDVAKRRALDRLLALRRQMQRRGRRRTGATPRCCSPPGTFEISIPTNLGMAHVCRNPSITSLRLSAPGWTWLQFKRSTRIYAPCSSLMGRSSAPTGTTSLPTSPRAPSGNDERIAFLFDKNKGELPQPGGRGRPARERSQKRLIEGKREQFARTPFYATFQARWFKFNLCTVHIYYGEENSGPALARRVGEIDHLAAFLAAQRQQGERGTYISLGDFNVISPEHQTMQALLRHGFTVPESAAQRTHQPLPDQALRPDRAQGPGEAPGDRRIRRARLRSIGLSRRRRGFCRLLSTRCRPASQRGCSEAGRAARLLRRRLAHLADVRSPADVGAAQGRFHRGLSREPEARPRAARRSLADIAGLRCARPSP